MVIYPCGKVTDYRVRSVSFVLIPANTNHLVRIHSVDYLVERFSNVLYKLVEVACKDLRGTFNYYALPFRDHLLNSLNRERRCIGKYLLPDGVDRVRVKRLQK